MSETFTNTHQGVTIEVSLHDNVHIPGAIPQKLCDLMIIPQGSRVADVGCGCGYLGIVAALLGAADVISIDPLVNAVELTQRNAALNGVTQLRTICGTELTQVLDQEIDVVLCNPPQTPFPENFNTGRYGGPEGCEVIERIIAQAARVLNPGGRLYLLHVSYANPARVELAVENAGFKCKTIHSQTRLLDRLFLGNLHPELFDYIVTKHRSGTAELQETTQGFSFQHRIFEIT